MSQAYDEHTHPMVRTLARAALILDELADLDPVFMPTSDKTTAMDLVAKLTAMAAAAEARLLAASEDAATDAGCRNPADWLARETLDSKHHTTATLHLGQALTRWPQVASTLAIGEINTRQAHTITRALDALPTDDLDDELLRRAESHMLREATDFGPRELKRIGEHLLEVIAPDIADQHLFDKLQADERRALAQTRMRLRPRGDGSTDLFARLPDDAAERLRTIIDSIANPRRAPIDPSTAPAATGDTADLEHLPIHRRRGLALTALINKIPADWLPTHGAQPTTMVILKRLQRLLADLPGAERIELFSNGLDHPADHKCVVEVSRSRDRVGNEV